MKYVCMTKCINTLTKFFLNINVVFARVIILNTVYWWWFRNGKRQGRLSITLLTDLSSALDCIKHDLLKAKLAEYEFDSHSWSFTFSYLNERKQRTKIHNSYSPYANIAVVNIRSFSFQYKHLLHVFWKLRIWYCQLCWW